MAITRDDTRLTPAMIQQYTAQRYWTAGTLADVFRRNATDLTDEVAYIDDRSEVTWGALWQTGGEIASGLAGRGVRRGDVVVVQLPNQLEFVYLLVAVARLGAVFCPCPTNYRARELEFILGFAEAQAVVVPQRFAGCDHREMIDGLRPRLPKLALTIAVSVEDSDGPLDRSDWVTPAALRAGSGQVGSAPDRAGDANDVVRIAFTSGTTGDPKAVMHTANTTLSFVQKVNEVTGVSRDAVILVLLPVGLNAGFGAIVQVAAAGCRGVLMGRFDAATLLDEVQRHGVTTFVAAPTALIAILAQPGLDETDLSSLRLVQTGGSATPVSVLRDANERLGCPVIDIYGMLETGLTSSTSQHEPFEQWVGTVGRPYPWMQLRILDEDDRDVPIGSEGEIAKSGPTITVGYLRNPKKNAESWTPDGWFRSGDRGYLDASGRLTISGRSKDMIIHGGANIWPRELEEILSHLTDVAQAAVIGIPDDYFGENVCACLIPRGDASITLADLITYMEPQVAKYKLPQHLELFEAFPLGPTGKVLKDTLAREVEKRRAGQTATQERRR